MDPDRSATSSTQGAAALLRPYVDGASGRDLRAQLTARHPECSPEEIEDAVQDACRCFLDEAEGITDRDQIHVWLRTTAHRILGHEGQRQRREVATDPGGNGFEGIAVDRVGPRLGIEFVLDVAPASRKPALVTARAQKGGAIAHDDVSVVAASSV